MRHSKAEKAKTHKRIVAIASKRFREEGLAGIGIADLMKEAGLTVGGFYKHFKSRDALVAEAVGSALELWKRQVDAAASGGPPVTYESLIDEYLSEAHRNHPGTGCPVGALAGDLARTDRRTRAIVSRKIRDNIVLLARVGRSAHKGCWRRQRALVDAVSQSSRFHAKAPRPIRHEELSREILKTAAQRLKELAAFDSTREG